MGKVPASHHVVSAIGGGWVVRRGGSERASKRFPTKAAAESWGREQSIKDRSELVIHRDDGTVVRKHSYRKNHRRPRSRQR